jgi:hypothetical protein
MTSTELDTDAECIARNECPICCDGPRRAQINARRALQEHLRASKDPAHMVWREAGNYQKHFRRGGNMCTKTATSEDVLKSIEHAFGKQWVQRISIANTAVTV